MLIIFFICLMGVMFYMIAKTSNEIAEQKKLEERIGKSRKLKKKRSCIGKTVKAEDVLVRDLDDAARRAYNFASSFIHLSPSQFKKVLDERIEITEMRKPKDDVETKVLPKELKSFYREVANSNHKELRKHYLNSLKD